MSADVAALYVQTGGCYYGLEGVDPWDEKRDARLYNGPHPVIAHPPCQLWGSLAYVNYARYGGDHNKPGNDGGCFKAAVDAVLQYGGVLEHPAFTRAWEKYGLVRPTGIGWHNAGDYWVCEVWQSAYGHLAQKRTWLLYAGRQEPHQMRWERVPGTHRIGHNSTAKTHKPVLRGKAASATPKEFRDELLALARGAAR